MRHVADSSITPFKLAMSFEYGGKTPVDKWLKFVVKNKVKELDLRIRPWYDKRRDFYYYLPKTVLRAQSLTLQVGWPQN